MTSNIKSVTIPFPVERMRGGPVVVAAQIELEDGTKLTGLATTDDDSEKGILEAFSRAQASAAAQCQPQTQEVPRLQEALREGARPAVERIFSEKREAGDITEEQYAMLNGAPDDHKVRELSDLCDALGLSRIKVVEKGWSMLDTIACISALKKLAKRLETE